MKVSIITICYNSAATIEATIESVVQQSYSNIEYIIIDGASKDDTLSIVDRYKSHISKVVSEKDNGIYDAMNKGVSLASGDIIGILNSDDFYAYPDVLSDIVKRFQQTHADALYADLVYVDRNNAQRIRRYWKAGTYRHGKFLRGWMPPHPTFFVKKEVYEKYGVYTTDLKSSSDYEFMLRVLHKHKISVTYFPRVITKMRTGGQSNASVIHRAAANREDKKAWEMNGLKPRAYTILLKPISKIGQFLRKKG